MRDPWIARLEPTKKVVIRRLMLVLSFVFGVACSLGLWIEAGLTNPGVALWIFGVGLTGSIVFGLGALKWTGRDALRTRILGWILLAAFVASAGTLVLAAPLVAFMGLGLGLIEGSTNAKASSSMSSPT